MRAFGLATCAVGLLCLAGFALVGTGLALPTAVAGVASLVLALA